jgi:hypothetical protein
VLNKQRFSLCCVPFLFRSTSSARHQAGTGKSTLLRTMIKALRYQHGDAAVAVTASTGAAATILGGTTIHSFAGCGIAVEE